MPANWRIHLRDTLLGGDVPEWRGRACYHGGMTSPNWVHLATAPDQVTAEIWVDILRDAGIAAMIRASDAVSFLGVSSMGCRVLVMEADRDRARETLGEDATDEGEV
jgi:hypothetical protein